MSPSPGTSRCDDATVPTLEVADLHEPDAIDAVADRRARSRSAQHALTSMHTPVSSRRARSIASRSVCTNPTSTRNEFVCSIANVDAVRACASASTGASAAASASAASSHVSGANGPVVNTMHGTPSATAVVDRAHEPLALRVPPFGLGEVERAEPDEVGDAQAARRPRAATSGVPSSQPNASSLATDTPTRVDAVRVPEREVFGEREPERGDRAHARARMHALSEREAAGDAAAAVELQVDAGDELRLAAREVHRGVRDVVGDAEPREVHALVACAPFGA